MNTPIKVLIVDDHRLFREGLATLLREAKEIEVIADAHNGKDAIIHVRELNPDVVLMDIEMPEMDGIEAIRLISHPICSIANCELPIANCLSPSPIKNTHLGNKNTHLGNRQGYKLLVILRQT